MSSSKSRVGSAEPCVCGCGRPQGTQRRRGLRNGCYARWIRQGKPERGPGPPLSQAECTARLRAVKAGQAAEFRVAAELPPDGYDLEWAAGEAARRLRRAWPQAAALRVCLAAGDEKGADLLRHRIRDWEAVAEVLTRRVSLAAPALLALAAPVAAPEPGRTPTVALRAVQEESDAA